VRTQVQRCKNIRVSPPLRELRAKSAAHRSIVLAHLPNFPVPRVSSRVSCTPSAMEPIPESLASEEGTSSTPTAANSIGVTVSVDGEAPASAAAGGAEEAPRAKAEGGEHAASGEPPCDPANEYVADEHMMKMPELAARWSTDINNADPAASKGLAPGEAAERLARDGPNVLTPPAETPEIIKFLKQFLDGFMIMLTIAGALCFLA
jgi:hypothetical protein